ncbi:MAG: Trk system potassium transporter TrkA [Sphaerochaeta sp.]|uniref:Trk system potassium transporter TrkA n=1 Tax=Sphaerochaeta TaxID=399320 RepID=UPI0025825D90|nr:MULTISPECIES: Trk system potassium transporter TrkA [Sphaerochaeta]MDD4038081.1 Trk system potassium transporter TrkA [Sphaerochaeta sp.]MEA5029800.1 Trk system potassium transporter TrkA [Sphaerochaeta associata]
MGAGRRGLGLAKQLIVDGKDVVLIDNSHERIESAVSKLDCLGILGNGTDIAKLMEADIEHAQAFIAVTNSDEINLVSCGLVSSSYPQVKTVAAIRSLIYTGADGLKEGLLGIDYIVNPNAETAKSIFNIIEQGVNGNVLGFTNSKLLLYNFFIEPFSSYVGSTVMEMRNKLQAEFVIASINRRGLVIVPSGNTTIQARDTLSIVADSEEVTDILKTVGQLQKKPNNMVLVGASRITRALLNRMSPSMRSKVAVVDQDEEVCRNFSERFREILVIKADITDEDIMAEEQLGSYDLLVALTDNDELNIITASYAKRIGVDRSIALIKQNNNYTRMASYLDIDVVISTTDTTVESLLRYLRGTNVSSIHTLFNDQLEVYEFVIRAESLVCNKQLKDINMRKKAIVAGLTDREGNSTIPTGLTTLKEGDTVLVAVMRDSSEFIQKLFG